MKKQSSVRHATKTTHTYCMSIPSIWVAEWV